jgi:hypothetical protein
MNVKYWLDVLFLLGLASSLAWLGYLAWVADRE